MLTLLLSAALQDSTHVRLQDLNLSGVTQDWGTAQKNKSVDGHRLSVAGTSYDLGLGTHSTGRIRIALHGQARSFDAKGGIDDEATQRGSVRFQIWVDGGKIFETGLIRKGDAPESLHANLTGAKELLLVVTDGGDGNDNDHADYLDPVLTVNPGAKLQIETAPPEKLPVIAHGTGASPMINGARVLGCTAGHDFIWRIPASGQGPLTFHAEGLPRGLELNPTTGIITGQVADKARTPVKLTATGPNGRASRLIFVDSRGVLALTPPMGWNSWNVWGTSVTADKVRAAAKEFIDTGLANYGYTYVNIDDAWEGPRGSDGIITTNEKFGDMRSLADYVHGLGLRIGIYSGPGPTTCGGYPASYQFEKQDADTYARWGIDYLKYDWCSYGSIEPHPDKAALEKPYILMHDKLVDSGRDIVFSLCQYGMGDVWNWGAEVGGNLWRCTGDINDTWGSLEQIAFAGGKWAGGGGPGHWNDPDMLVVGRLGWGDHPHPTRLTPNEQMTHITMWAMQAAPLLMGCDLTHLDTFTFDLLTNHDVVDVDQDPLGNPAKPIEKAGTSEVWARPLFSGGYAVALFNRAEAPTSVTFHFSKLGLQGEHQIRDLWRMKNLGKLHSEYTVVVPRHGAALISVK